MPCSLGAHGGLWAQGYRYFLTAVFSFVVSGLWADDAPPAVSDSRTGTLVIAGGGILPPSILDRFLELGGGPEVRLVIITTASTLADSPEVEERLKVWTERPLGSFQILHTRSRLQADDPEFVRPLKSATAVWFIGGNQNWLAQTYLGTQAEAELHRLMQRGGVIGGTSAGAAIMSRVMIGGGRTEPILTTGFGFLPNTIVDQHFLKRNRFERLNQAVQHRPGNVGIGIDEETALVVHPDTLEVVGNSEVVVFLPQTPQRPQVRTQIKAGQSLDLGKWTAAAAGRARLGSYLTADKPPTPNVRQGSVVIAGSNTPNIAVERFLEAAGGKEAPVVVVAEGDEADRLEEQFAAIGAMNLRVVRAATRKELGATEVHQSLAAARGVWFSGSREQRMLDLVAHSPVRRLVDEVLQRGGAIGGSSAGACIQGDGLLCSLDSPEADPLAEAYEHGLGLLAGLVIEQQAKDATRSTDLSTVLRQRFPHCVGLGLTNSAAVVVQGHTMEVVGSDSVSVITCSSEANESPTPAVVQSGQRYDFLQRRLMASDETDSTR